MFASRFKPLISTVAVAGLLSVQLAPLAHARASAAGDYAACQVQSEADFASAIGDVTLAALNKSVAALDYDALVRDAWRRGDIGSVIDTQVDVAVDQVRSESSWTSLLKSLAYKEIARKLATAVAERVYRSDPVKRALEVLAVDVGKDVGKAIEIATQDAAGPAVACVRAFLGPRYGPTVARVVSINAEREFDIDPKVAAAKVRPGGILIEGSGAIAGAVILLVRRQLSRLAQRIGQRVVGAVLGRIVALVAGGIGLVLIAKDIWDFRYGVLPIIADEMKSPSTKVKVQALLSKTLAEQMGANIKDLSAKTSERIVEVWRAFRRAHAKVVELTARHPAFKTFLQTVRPDRLARLDELVVLVLAEAGEAGVLKRVADGTLHKAVNTLPEPAVQIARDTQSLVEAMRWEAFVPEALAQIVAHDVHRKAKPASFTREGLLRILALDDKLAVSRLVALKREAREPLYQLQADELQKLARALPETELGMLSRYLTSLKAPAAQRVLQAVALDASKMQLLSRPLVRDAILSSRDQSVALEFVLRVDSGLNPAQLVADGERVLDGQISPTLLWAKRPYAVSTFGIVLLVVFLFLWRLLFGRRTKVIVQAPPPAANS